MKFVLVLVSTMFLVATAWPSPWERDEVMNFNEMANVEQNYPICTSLVKVIVSGKQYDLEGCQSGKLAFLASYLHKDGRCIYSGGERTNFDLSGVNSDTVTGSSVYYVLSHNSRTKAGPPPPL